VAKMWTKFKNKNLEVRLNLNNITNYSIKDDDHLSLYVDILDQEDNNSYCYKFDSKEERDAVLAEFDKVIFGNDINVVIDKQSDAKLYQKQIIKGKVVDVYSCLIDARDPGKAYVTLEVNK